MGFSENRFSDVTDYNPPPPHQKTPYFWDFSPHPKFKTRVGKRNPFFGLFVFLKLSNGRSVVFGILEKTNGRSFFDIEKKRTVVRTETEKKRNERKPVFRFFRSFFTPQSPVNYTATPVNYTATPVNYTATPVLYTALPINYTATPVNYTATPVIYTALPINYTATPVIYTARLSLLAGEGAYLGSSNRFEEQLAGSFSSVLSSNHWTISSSNALALSQASLTSRHGCCPKRSRVRRRCFRQCAVM
jgi:hypothetical protein